MLRRITNLFHRSKLDQEIEAELHSHIEMRTADSLAAGMSPEEAANTTQRVLGNTLKIEEDVRAAWRFQWIETLVQDVRYGIRMLLKKPGFTTIALPTLMRDIGGNATVFSWIRGTLLHPIPAVPESGRLVAVETVLPDGEFHTSSYLDFRDYSAQNQAFSGLIGFELVPVNMSWGGHKQDERVWGEIVTENYFDVLGVSAERGRLFRAGDNRGPSSDPYIILSHNFWKSHFHGDPNIVGRSLEINLHDFAVTGIAPPGFQGTIVGVGPDYWVPMMMQPVVLPGADLQWRGPTFVHLMGKLKLGVSIPQAQANVSAIANHLAQEYPQSDRGIGVTVNPVWKAHYGAQDLLLKAVVFLAVVVLLIACAKIANLLLARATSRHREIAIRSALGASRPRLLRHFFIENVLLALAGGAGGTIIRLWSVNFLSAFLPNGYFPVSLPVGVDGKVLAFTAVLCVLAGVIFGLDPALRSASPNLIPSLKESARTVSGDVRHARLRNALVVSGIALASVRLVAAGLLIRTMKNVQSASPGFNPNHVLLAALDLAAMITRINPRTHFTTSCSDDFSLFRELNPPVWSSTGPCGFTAWARPHLHATASKIKRPRPMNFCESTSILSAQITCPL
jgi:putative ABC transport system permease protein